MSATLTFTPGEFRGSEFVPHTMTPNFQDPTFDQASRTIAQVVPAAIVQWLMLGGIFTMRPLKSRRSWPRFAKEYAVARLLTVVVLGIAVGTALGWFLSKL